MPSVEPLERPTDGVSAEAWLRIMALEFSPQRLQEILQAYGENPEAVFAGTPSDLRQRVPALVARQVEHFDKIRRRDFKKELDLVEKLAVHFVTQNDIRYPANLRQIPDAPPVLSVRGELIPEDRFSVAIVGSRRASSYGTSLGRKFAEDLSAHGLSIISGGARGIDTYAHRGAIAANGRTVAYLGCGVDIAYPLENKGLYKEIAEGRGAVVSEFAIGAKPEPWHFPARNRLISGTALGVLVIESPLDSGSLITAREAGEQGRDVFAIPGPIDTGRNAGCHKLIQDGAKLVQTVDDILEELGVLTLRSPDQPAPTLTPPNHPNLPPEQRAILHMLTLEARTVDSLIVESGLTAPQVTGILTLLEMRGIARRVPGNAFVRVL